MIVQGVSNVKCDQCGKQHALERGQMCPVPKWVRIALEWSNASACVDLCEDCSIKLTTYLAESECSFPIMRQGV